MDLVQMCNLRKGTKWLYNIVTVVTIFSQHWQRVFGAVHLSEHIVRSTPLERRSSPDNIPFDAHCTEGLRPGIASSTSSSTLWQQTVAPGTGQIVVIVDLTRKVGGSDIATAKVRCDGRRPDLGHAHDQYGRGQFEIGGQ